MTSHEDTFMIINPNSKLVLIGDSITDCGRARPVGEGLFEALGKGYVSLVDAFLQAKEASQRIRVVNMGTSGNTVRDLKARWQSDVFDLAPDWLSLMIGINDVWRQFDSPLQTEWGVPLDEYERTLVELIESTRPLVKGFILMTPYFIEPNKGDAMRARMDEYSEVVRGLAKKNEIVLVDTQAAFDRVLRDVHPMALAWDRVHPNLSGHMVIARAFLNAIGYRWD
jgi:lysophospholipase L1-like esterase